VSGRAVRPVRMNLLSRKLMGSNCQRSNWLADVRRPERKKPNLAGWAFCFLLDESWCRLPVSNWPPDDYKSPNIGIHGC
jgi:hypothetical protein